MLEINSQWHYVADTVMGGVSQGQLLSIDEGTRLQGQVSLENNGGFIQMQTLFPKHYDASHLNGLWFDWTGDGGVFVVSLKTSQLWMPWQSYRVEGTVNTHRETVQISFGDFKPYRTSLGLNVKRIEKVGILAIGEARSVNLSVHRWGVY